MRTDWGRFDWIYFLAVVMLTIIGIVMIFSTSGIVGFSYFQDSYYFVKRHLVYVLVGVLAMGMGLALSPDRYRNWLFPGFSVSVLLLLLCFVPGLGVRIAGATRWLNLVVFQFQPSEFAKFFVCVFLATYLSRKSERLSQFWRGMFPALAVTVLMVGILALQPDLGNVLLLMFTTGILLFVSRTNLLHLVGLASIGLIFVIGSILTHPYQMERVKGFLDPWADPTGRSYHLVQSMIAVGSGGILGEGLGESKLKYFYIPLQYADFIFAILCEEGGLVLATITLILYAIVLFRGIALARRPGPLYYFYLGTGLTCFLILQAVINIGVVVGLLPVTGIPLTWISFGGTAVIMSLFFAGVILRIGMLVPRGKHLPSEDQSVEIRRPPKFITFKG